MNGFEALEKLKANSSWADIPVIFLTGTVDASIEERSSKSGAAGIISKPFSAPALQDRVKSHVK
jgi:putative two-component system response regulator